ncbi:MAG TPA: alpha/beta hydrolase [Mucilaginibacter sp.]|jgi:pimeloyl-ACP methyl ester carboxylesterase|nr:alpha/beta hydrolase [Mucilaginibacter sp.]
MKTVTSKDGTQIAYDQTGSGPAVVLVDGALCSRAFGPLPSLAKLLEPHFTVFNYDRRGRNQSGDTQPYDRQREIEDLDAVIQAAGGSAFVAGVSSGAALTLAGAAAGLNMKKIALYEAPFMVDKTGHQPPKDSADQLKKLIAEERRADAVKFFMRDMVNVPGFAVFIMSVMPIFKKLKAVAHTLPYDASIMGDFSLPRQKAALVKVQALVGGGEKSPVSMQNAVKQTAAAIPGSVLKMFPGQTHNISMKVLAPALIEFFNK